MRDFDSTLWRISAFERAREAGEASPGVGFDRPTLLPTTLLADLQRLEASPAANDVLEVIAACLRNREAALLYLAHGPYVWPVTLFPTQQLYHSPVDVSDIAAETSLSQLKLISAEPPGVMPPGHPRHERVAASDKYRPISALLWAVALNGPRDQVLAEIGGKAAYRLAGRIEDLPHALGALLPATMRLRQDSASLRDIAAWPGMSPQRAARLLNALYLTGSLMVTRSHPAARDQPAGWRGLFSRRK
ncbi:MAG: hypothetical protein Tsb007_25190 [Rhizobacter sp.]